MNSISNNISFGAKLDYKHIVGGSQTRLEKIAQIFENKTKQHPNDVFEIRTWDNGEIVFSNRYSNKKLKAHGSFDYGSISSETTNLLETFSAKKVADIFKRLFVIRKNADSIVADHFYREDKYNLIDIVHHEKIENYLNASIEVRKDYAKNKVKEDKILKTLDVEIG